jgi:hypothetical protein
MDWKLFERPADIYMVCIVISCNHQLDLFDIRASSPFSDSIFCRLWVVSSTFGGYTAESSRLGHIAQHRALSSNLVNLELP